MSITKFREIVDRIAGDLVQWTKATENRWLALILTVFAMLILRAAGAPGVADLLGMVYIMYFITFWRRHD